MNIWNLKLGKCYDLALVRRSPIGSGRTLADVWRPTGPDRTRSDVRRTSDTILGLILTILGLNAFIWSPRRTSTPIGLRWNLRLPFIQMKKSDRTPSDWSKIEYFIKISPIGLFWSLIGLVRSDSDGLRRTPTDSDGLWLDSDKLRQMYNITVTRSETLARARTETGRCAAHHKAKM